MKLKRRVAVAGAAALAALGGWFLFGGRGEKPRRAFPPLPYRAAGITISSVPSGGLASGETVQGLGGDYLVQNGKIAFVVGGENPGLERRARRGALIDLVARGEYLADELIDFRTFASVDGKPLSLQVIGTELVTAAKFPHLRVEQATQDGRVKLVTDLLAAPSSQAIRVQSELTNLGDRPLRAVELGDRTRWPGAPSFAPRIGFPKVGTRAEIPWLARQGRSLSYALAFPNGPAAASFFFDRIGQIGQETVARLGDVPAGASAQFTRELLVVEGDLGRAAELALKATGRKLGKVSGKLEPAPTWARLDALYPDGKPAMSVRAADDGRYSLPLPPGDYLVKLEAPGGTDQAQVRVDAGATVTPRLIAPEAGLLKYRVVTDTGVLLPSRLVIRGIAPTADPELGPGEQNVVFSRTGEGQVELRPGRYKVVFTHGPEYSLLEKEIDVSAAIGDAVHATLEHVVDTRGWIGCDFHVHAAPSHDSSVTLDDRVMSLVAEGVEFAVPTDHNHVTDYEPSIHRENAQDSLATTSGVEVTTLSWGHFNAFPYPLAEPAPPYAGVGPGEIFAHVRARAPSAVIQVNHPRMPGVGYFNRIELDSATGLAASEDAALEFDALEVVNGYDLEAPGFIQQNLREYFALLNVGRRYTATGNSDSHRLIINWVGYPRTYVRVADDRPGSVGGADVAQALARGRVVVANGIFPVILANGTAGPGDTVTGSRVTMDIEARAPRWVDVSSAELWVNGALIESAPRRAFTTGTRRLLWRTELDLEEDAWIVLVVRGERPMSSVFVGRRVLPFAFTNPLFVDANEDGVLDAPEQKSPMPSASVAPP
ncbi:MAG: CehA/McbA family metallohydrolase [Myxococcota bacterium]|nr:CehA/McbA family metallohydrolase [Myxococcota bacterium]